MLVRILNYSFLLLIFTLPFVQPANLQISQLTVQFTDIIFLLVCLIFIFSILLKKIRFKVDSFFLLLLFYFTALFLSSIFSTNPQKSFVKLLGEIYLMGLCVLTFNIVRTIEFFKKVVFVWLSAMCIVSLISVLTVVLFYVAPENGLLSITLHHYGTLIPGNYPRLQTTFFYPSMLCHYLSIGLMLLLISVKNEWLDRRFFFFLLAITLITLFFTLTPGLGGVGLSLGVWLWLKLKEKSKPRPARFSLIAGIMLAIGFFCTSLISPIQTMTSPYFVSVPYFEKRLDPSVRVLTWQSSLETFIKNPIFGKGLGTDAANVLYRDASDRTQNLRDAHQIWLNVAAESGIFGLTAFLMITLFLWRKCFPLKIEVSEKNIIKSGLAIAFLSAFIFQGLIGSFEDARHLWILFGLILAATRFNS